MTSSSTGPSPNVRYRIFFEPWQVYRLCAYDINASKSAAVALGSLDVDCDDEWQVVNASQNTFGIRSLRYQNDSNLLAVFNSDPDTVTPASIIFPDNDDDFPTRAQWELEESSTQDIYSVQNSANGTDWYLGAADEQPDTGAGQVYMRDWGTNLTAIGRWTFVSQGVLSSTATATSTTGSSSSSTSSPSASNTAAQSGSSEQPDNNNGSGGLSTGAKAGIAVGAVVGVLLVALAAFFLFRRRRRQRQSTNHAGDPIPPTQKPPMAMSAAPAELDGSQGSPMKAMRSTTPSELMGSYSSREYQPVPQQLDSEASHGNSTRSR